MAYLEREFHKYNEVSFDVECWLLSETAASLSYVCDVGHPGGGGGGGWCSSENVENTPKVTRILFYGRVPNLFPPLRGTNLTTTNYITGT